VQLIIRRQIRSGISGVNGGGCEIRAAVKAERVAHTTTPKTHMCVYSKVHYIRPTKAKYSAECAKVPKSAKWDSRRKYVILKSRRSEIPFLRNARQRVKYLGKRNKPSILNYSNISSYQNLCLFSFSDLFTNFRNYYMILCNFLPVLNYPSWLTHPC